MAELPTGPLWPNIEQCVADIMGRLTLPEAQCGGVGAGAEVDKTIKIWDVRSPQRELTTLTGHGWVAVPGPGR